MELNWFSKWTNRSTPSSEQGGQLRPVVRASGSGGRSGAKGQVRHPHFKVLATDQLHHGRGDDLEKARAKLREAFTPSQPVSHISMFAGRTAVLTRLIRAIEDQQLHAVVYGERGIGKTSLLRIVSMLADEAKYIVCYTSCGEGSSFSDIFRSVAGSIPLLFHSGYDPTQAETEGGGTLADLLPPGDVTPHQISELFSRLSATRVLIILDEFDRSPSGPFRRMMAELIKNLSDRSTRVQIVIAGVAGNLAELVEHIPSIRRNILGLQVPNMTAEEVGELIGLGSATCGLDYTEDAIALVAEVSCGLPYIASLLSQHAGISTLDRQATTVERSDVAAALELATEETVQRLSERSLRLIDRIQVQGNRAGLIALADRALHNAGLIELDTGNIELASAIEVGLTGQLLEPIGDEIGERFRFIEEGVPVYLWMRFVEESLQASRPAGVAKAR